MKCSKCGHRARTIQAMAKHYRRAHPGSMKHSGPRKPKMTFAKKAGPLTVRRFCPHCGGFLGD